MVSRLIKTVGKVHIYPAKIRLRSVSVVHLIVVSEMTRNFILTFGLSSLQRFDVISSNDNSIGRNQPHSEISGELIATPMDGIARPRRRLSSSSAANHKRDRLHFTHQVCKKLTEQSELDEASDQGRT